MQILTLGALIFLLNVPFGYWRSNHDKFTLPWFISIHAPVPIVAAARRLNGYDLHYLPIFVLFFAGGQYVGRKLRPRLVEVKGVSGTGCMFVDMWEFTQGTLQRSVASRKRP